MTAALAVRNFKFREEETIIIISKKIKVVPPLGTPPPPPAAPHSPPALPAAHLSRAQLWHSGQNLRHAAPRSQPPHPAPPRPASPASPGPRHGGGEGVEEARLSALSSLGACFPAGPAQLLLHPPCSLFPPPPNPRRARAAPAAGARPRPETERRLPAPEGIPSLSANRLGGKGQPGQWSAEKRRVVPRGEPMERAGTPSLRPAVPGGSGAALGLMDSAGEFSSCMAYWPP